MTLKRLIALTLSLALLVPLLAACGAGNTQTTSTTAPVADATAAAPAADATTAPAADAATAAPVAGGAGACYGMEVEPNATLRLQAAGNPSEQQLYIDGAARFQEACPGVTLTFEPLADYQTQMKSAFAAGTAPDVFVLDGELMGAFAPNGLLLGPGRGHGCQGRYRRRLLRAHDRPLPAGRRDLRPAEGLQPAGRLRQ